MCCCRYDETVYGHSHLEDYELAASQIGTHDLHSGAHVGGNGYGLGLTREQAIIANSQLSNAFFLSGTFNTSAHLEAAGVPHNTSIPPVDFRIPVDFVSFGFITHFRIVYAGVTTLLFFACLVKLFRYLQAYRPLAERYMQLAKAVRRLGTSSSSPPLHICFTAGDTSSGTIHHRVGRLTILGHSCGKVEVAQKLVEEDGVVLSLHIRILLYDLRVPLPLDHFRDATGENNDLEAEAPRGGRDSSIKSRDGGVRTLRSLLATRTRSYATSGGHDKMALDARGGKGGGGGGKEAKAQARLKKRKKKPGLLRR